MRRAVLGIIALLSVSACSSGLFSSSPSTQQKPAEEEPDSRRPTPPRDNRTRAKLHTELGSLYLQSQNFSVALEELTMAIVVDPDYAPAHGARGLVLYNIREMALADRDFQQALNLDPTDPELNNNYGWFLCQVGREKEAMPYLQRAMKNALYETPDRAYLNAGACYVKLGDLDAAEGFVQHSLLIRPNNPQALLQLAEINYRRGQVELAGQQLSDLLRKTEPNAEALWLAVRVERKLGDRLAEARYSAQLKRKFPLSPEAQELLKGNFE
ncbi:type IV pilus biogenesis/stability protein PilW [Candidatus Accumulibacter phosphatis]|jgi:type IV pilus assembly protein PilF|uniref:Type IV pilus biogenesis/stability protein PilW n=1 Tax=Candidatus Accumulibacter phosphatis TaxID=327160 RepID=A0ABX1U0X2_9PROT|nr:MULTISPECIES: type IV pilus biogenesis/stability protein PilW [Candidatus Accumulibacter]NMQ29123.1 type IV pilus biogenesis/stability protein PilW [Candidatus Accumulibacter phosphatis]